jgi:hypothetical protein
MLEDEMSNDLVNYYENQAGSGIPGFHGVKYQRGHGFFGRLLSKAVYPMLRFFGKQALNTGINVASDVIKDKKNFKESIKRRGIESGQNILDAGLKRAIRFQQTGEGKRRRRRRGRKSRKIINSKSKVIKRKNRKPKSKSIKRRRRTRKRINTSLF